MACDNLRKPRNNEEKKQIDILKRMIENGTSADKLKSFIERLINRKDSSSDFWTQYSTLNGENLKQKLIKDFVKANDPEHKKYVRRDGRYLPTMNDFNRSGLTRDERVIIKKTIEENVVDRCLFDLTGGSGEIKSLEKLNENLLQYKLELMLKLAESLGFKDEVTIRTVEDIFHHPQGQGEYHLQQLFDRIESLCYGNNALSENVKRLYNILTYFDTILLSVFDKVIGFDSEYEDDGYIYAHKYVYLGPGANMRKGHQDNRTEGYAAAWDNMSNMTKMISDYIPRYTIVEGIETPRGTIGENMATYLFAELWDYVVNLYNSEVFRRSYASKHPAVFLAISSAIDNPGSADWGVILNHYITTHQFGDENVIECMRGLRKHVFEKGKGTWLYEDFVSCIQKYRKTAYGIISRVRNSEHNYMEFNELRLWSESQANFKLQDQLAYSTVANHIRYSTPEERLSFAKQIGLKAIDDSSFSIQIEGQDVVITIKKGATPKTTTFEIDGIENISDEAITKFMLVHMNVNISKDALLMLQNRDFHKENEIERSAGEIKIKPRTTFKKNVAPLFGLWVNSVFDEAIEIDGKTFKPILAYEQRYFGKNKLKINNFAPYYKQLHSMSEILRIVHNENVSNVIKNGKGNNVPTTQLATIQHDGPTLRNSVERSEAIEIRHNIENFTEKLNKAVANGKRGNVTKGFESISQYNPSLSQPDFCEVNPKLSAGLANGPLVKESKEFKTGELIHNELMYLFAQSYFDEQGRFIYSQATANADKNLQALRGLALDVPISYTGAMGIRDHQNATLRSIIEDSINGNDDSIFEYYKLHNAKAILALENNICHSYNCAFCENDDWVFVDNIKDLMSQLIRLRHAYLSTPKAEKSGKFDWTLSSIKKQFRDSGLDFNETTFGVTSTVKSIIEGKLQEIDCVIFPKDMVKDMQIARNVVNGDYASLVKQSFMYEKAMIEDMIDEVCDINILTDTYYKQLHSENAMIQNWTTANGDMILAKFTRGSEVINLTTYSSADDIARFKAMPKDGVKINPLLHAYHNVQFAINTQMTEAYNGSRFSIGVKDDGFYVLDFDEGIPIDEEYDIAVTNYEKDHESDDTERKKEKAVKREKQARRRTDHKKEIDKAQKEWHKSYLKIENNRMVGYYKRATVNGTREHRILHGDKYNVPEQVYTATFVDPEGWVFLNSSIAKKCKAQDGSIWVTPWHALQMDVGAGEAKLPPGVRKTMYHDIDPITGGATLLKMAEFPITNEIRRMSQDDKMNMEIVLMELGSRKLISFEEGDIDAQLGIKALNDFFSGKVFYEQQKYDMSAKDFGDYYAFKIELRIHDGKLQIAKKKWKVGKNGEGDIRKAEVLFYKDVKTIYQIDRILGGAFSCDLTKSGLENGEAQNHLVNKIICELGLKSNYTAYAVNQESVKNNIKNVNSAKEWFDTGKNLPTDIESLVNESKVWTSKISTKFGGIILNALHEMDEDIDVARGVQMLSEMIQNGNQYGDVERIYSNVRLGIQDALKDYVKALSKEDNKALQEIIFDTIIDSVVNGKDRAKTSMAQEFVLGIKAAKEEKGIDISAFPISDKALYDLLITTIVGKINKEGIRARNAGFGGVKHPSFGVAKIYEIYVPDPDDPRGEKMIKLTAKYNDAMDEIIKFMKSDDFRTRYNDWSAEDFFREIQKDGALNPFIKRSASKILDVDLGETIVYKENGKWKSFEISSDREYQYFKRVIEPIIVSNEGIIYRNVFAGRRLRGYRTDCIYEDEHGNKKHDLMFNTDDHYLISSTQYVREAFEKIAKIMRNEELEDPKKDITAENIMSFLEKANTLDEKGNYVLNAERRLFIANCKSIVGFDFRDDFTIDDLLTRAYFINQYYNKDEDNNLKTFFANVTGKDFDTWVSEEYGNIIYDIRGFNVVKEIPDDAKDEKGRTWNKNSNDSEERDEAIKVIRKNILKRSKKQDKFFQDILNKFLEEQRLIGVDTFTENGEFHISKRVKNESGKGYHFVKEIGKISKSETRKAEYMKSKGNIAKQFLLDRGDSMFTVMSKGYKFFEDKLKSLYAQPDDPRLIYDVVIYDKHRRPVYVKYDPKHKFAQYFSRQNGEFYSTRNGIFKESNGKIYYKDKEFCDGNKMTSWMKHGENGEKFQIITVFDTNTFHELLQGKYGKRDGFAHRVIPRITLNDDISKQIFDLEAQILGLSPDSRDIEYWRESSEGLSDEEIIAKNRWTLAEDDYNAWVNQWSEEKLLTDSWDGFESNSFDNWIRREAKSMWASFKKQLSAIGTRIPSQNMQSMMAMECVGYIDADYNEEMASIEMTYIQGSDYDIDKDYVTEYFIDGTGFVGDGSKLQQFAAFKEHLDELPAPNGNGKTDYIKYPKLVGHEKWDIRDWTDEDRKNYYIVNYNDAKNIIDWVEGRNNIDQFDKFLSILNAVNSGKKLHIDYHVPDTIYKLNYITSDDYKKIMKSEVIRRFSKKEQSAFKSWFSVIPGTNGNRKINDTRAYYVIGEYVAWACNKYGENVWELKHGDKPLINPLFRGFGNSIGKLRKITNLITMHQTSVVTTTKDSQNISLSKELDILSNPKNIAAMEVSVDLSLDELKDFAKENGVQSKNGLSVWSAASKFKAQDTNLLGKTGVGVAANADKVYFSVYYYHTKVLNDIASSWKTSSSDNDSKTIEKLTKVLVLNPFDDSDIRCVSKLNWNILKDVDNFNVLSAISKATLNEKQAYLVDQVVKNAAKYYDINKADLRFQALLKYLKTIGKDVDGPTLLSALVSAATDNAKELVLSKLNAFGDILDAYGMCATLGIPFKETAAIFTSPLLNTCVKEIRGDIYDPSNFASKLENSFGMFFAKFKNSKDEPRINSILTSAMIGNFAQNLGFKQDKIDLLKYRLPETSAEVAITRLRADNGSIDDIIASAMKSMGEAYSPNNFDNWDDEWGDDWEYILEAEMESFDPTVSQSSLEWKEATIIQKMAFVSFLKHLKLRNNAVIAELYKAYNPETMEWNKDIEAEQFKSIEDQVKNLEKIRDKLMPKLHEQQMLHKTLGVTKGIEGKPQQLYRYIRELEYFINRKYKKAGYKDDANQDLKFDFVEFFKNPEYAKKHIELYDNIREFTNVLECLYENEYISEMLKTVGTTNELLSRISFVYKHTQNIAKEIESQLGLNRPLNLKEYGVIAGLVHEWLIQEFLTYHSPTTSISIKLDPERNERVYVGDNFTNTEGGHTNLRIAQLSDIASFKRMANLFLFPDLLQDYIEHKGSEKFGGKDGNIFLEAIIAGGYQRIIPDAKQTAVAIEEIVWKLAYNMNENISDETSDYAIQLKRDFEAIFDLPLRYKDKDGNWVNRGITMGDFIYLYNLIVYKNSGTRNSFTKLFENAEELRKKSKILPQYNAFVALMDSKGTNFNFVGNDNFMNSVKLKLAAMKNSKLKDIVQKQGIKLDFVQKRDYPFDFMLSSYVKDDKFKQAEFYDEMTNLVTQNAVTKTSQKFGEPGIYYVQKSMLPESPEAFVEGFGKTFVWVETIEQLNELSEDSKKYFIVTDPELATTLSNDGYYKPYFKQSFVHSDKELIIDGLDNVIKIKETIVRLPYNSTFLTILENTINRAIERTRPMILRDAVRRLWDAANLVEDGLDFEDVVVFETANSVDKLIKESGSGYHRKFAKAWFDYSSKTEQFEVHINVDNCDDANVLLHEISHFLLLVAKAKDYTEYRTIANAFLNGVYEDNYLTKWNEFKEKYPKTVRNEKGELVQLSEDLLFDEFLIDALSKQTHQTWNLNTLVQALRPKDNTLEYKTYLNASKIISEKIESGEYEIKCD